MKGQRKVVFTYYRLGRCRGHMAVDEYDLLDFSVRKTVNQLGSKIDCPVI